MEHEELKQQVIEILNAQVKKDSKLHTAWTGNAESIKSAEIKNICLLRLEVDCRMREYRREKTPASEPWSPKSEKGSIDKWGYFPNWMRISGRDESDWEKADEFWEKCSDCDGCGKMECSMCGGSGKRTCPRCGGNGKIL